MGEVKNVVDDIIFFTHNYSYFVYDYTGKNYLHISQQQAEQETIIHCISCDLWYNGLHAEK